MNPLSWPMRVFPNVLSAKPLCVSRPARVNVCILKNMKLRFFTSACIVFITIFDP